jgi:hypothetical protein
VLPRPDEQSPECNRLARRQNDLFGAAWGGHFGNQVAEHIGGSCPLFIRCVQQACPVEDRR